jgi:hypothetical protein
MRTSKFIINLFLICSSFLFGQNALSLLDNGNGTWNIDYVSDSAITNFQFTVDGATISDASGGEAEGAGFFSVPDVVSISNVPDPKGIDAPIKLLVVIVPSLIDTTSGTLKNPAPSASPPEASEIVAPSTVN